jgi:hypothetical protein
MSLSTLSSFYYGHTVDTTNYAIDFKEGAGPELQASVDPGSYTLTDFAGALASALNKAGLLDYTVTIDRVTRKLTVAASGTFSLLVATGTRVSNGVWLLAGFSGADRTGAATYDGNLASASQFRPQFILQDHVPKERNIKAIDPVVNKSAAGVTEVVRFGTERMVSGNIKFITNRAMPVGAVIENSATGVEDAIAFMEYVVQKKPFEYIPDRDTPATFDKVILESTPKSQQGTDYEMKELYDQGLPGFFETGKLTMRVLE